jgi:valyl-tRNA synthetase
LDEVDTLADKWILSRFYEASEKVTKALEAYRFNDAASILYDFVWHQYCDWYLEISKFSPDKEKTQRVLLTILRGSLKLLHPLMPFVTEEIWQKIPGKDEGWIIKEMWPSFSGKKIDAKAISKMEKLIGIITAIRNARSFWNIDNKAEIEVQLSFKEDADKVLVEENELNIKKLAKCNISTKGKNIPRPAQSVAALVEHISVFIPLGDTIDIDKEKKRVGEKIEKLQGILSGVEKKLGNKNFVEKAPDEVVQQEKEKKERFAQQIKNLQDNLSALT